MPAISVVHIRWFVKDVEDFCQVPGTQVGSTYSCKSGIKSPITCQIEIKLGILKVIYLNGNSFVKRLADHLSSANQCFSNAS